MYGLVGMMWRRVFLVIVILSYMIGILEWNIVCLIILLVIRMKIYLLVVMGKSIMILMISKFNLFVICGMYLL